MSWNREQSIQRLKDRNHQWDLLIIGGGATGLGIAVDAAARGYQVALVERHDFGKGTSSRSTKLVHGGVRYLRQGNIRLVQEALQERTRLQQNAPHLVQPLGFIVPLQRWWEGPYFRAGFMLYDWLAGSSGFQPSRRMSKQAVTSAIPTVKPDGLRGGLWYQDGQFDDTRLLISLARTAVNHGGCIVNYADVTSLTNQGDRVQGATVQDKESGEEFAVAARCVINATGPFCDAVRRMDQPSEPAMVAASQGVHLVLPKSFLPGDTALMIPKTSDGRVLFVIPWHDHVVVGTTDTPLDRPVTEPVPFPEEMEFLLQTTGHYLNRQPTVKDVLSVFTGIRPLVKGAQGAATKALARDHTIAVSNSGLITITGGKWTTYRRMAQDCVNQAIKTSGLTSKPCVTESLRLHGYLETGSSESLQPFGSDQAHIDELAKQDARCSESLDDELPLIRGAEVVWGVREEMARTIEDVLARRTRALFLNQKAALRMAAKVGELMRVELHQDAAWLARQLRQFHELAAKFSP